MLCLRGAREVNSIVMVERDGRVYDVLTVYFSKTPRIVVLLADKAWLPYSARSWTGGDWDIGAVGGGEGIEEAEREAWGGVFKVFTVCCCLGGFFVKARVKGNNRQSCRVTFTPNL
jgi:hypothetical protein